MDIRSTAKKVALYAGFLLIGVAYILIFRQPTELEQLRSLESDLEIGGYQLRIETDEGCGPQTNEDTSCVRQIVFFMDNQSRKIIEDRLSQQGWAQTQIDDADVMVWQTNDNPQCVVTGKNIDPSLETDYVTLSAESDLLCDTLLEVEGA